jgi:hypothetical protein
MKTKWNVKELNSITIARLLGELEGATYFLDCLDEEDYNTLRNLCSKYYKLYFSLKKNES